MTVNLDSVDVLHVDDDPALTSLTAEFLEQVDERLSVETASDVTTGYERLDTEEFDCVISDYEMPERDGLDFLETVRTDFGELPFILFTGKGSETIASKAISAGVTDYLQKSSGADQYTVLANRIRNAVTNYRRKQKLQEYRQAVETAGDAMYALDEDGYIQMVNRAFVEAFGHTRSDVVDDHISEYVSAEAVQRGTESVIKLLNDETRRTLSYVFEETSDERETRLYENTLALIDSADADISGSVGIVRDITDKRNRMRYIERQNEQLAEFTSIVSQDLERPLRKAQLHLAEAREYDDLGALSSLDETLDRARDIATTLGELTTDPDPIGTERVDLARIARRAWGAVETEEATLETEGKMPLWAEEDHLTTLFEALFRGTVGQRTTADLLPEGATSAFVPTNHNPLDDWQPLQDTVRVGSLEQIHTATRAASTESNGFYVEDEGLTDTAAVRDALSGDAPPADQGGGPWPTTVKEVAIGHGWDIYVCESGDGSRIEFEGIATTSWE